MFKALLFVLVFFVSIPLVAAQSIRYIDESGNIHWVDSLQKIPPQYRDQVLKPTPAPGSEKAALEQQRKAEALKKQKDREDQRKKKEEERKKKQLAVEAERKKRVDDKQKAEQKEKQKKIQERNLRLTPAPRKTVPVKPFPPNLIPTRVPTPVSIVPPSQNQ